MHEIQSDLDQKGKLLYSQHEFKGCLTSSVTSENTTNFCMFFSFLEDAGLALYTFKIILYKFVVTALGDIMHYMCADILIHMKAIRAW